MSQQTETHYTCDICGSHIMGNVTWKGAWLKMAYVEPQVMLDPHFVKRDLDICYECWQAIRKTMEIRAAKGGGSENAK